MTTTSIIGFVLLGVLLLVLAGFSSKRVRRSRSDGGYWGGMFVDGGSGGHGHGHDGGSCGDGGGGGGDCGGA